MSVFHHLSSLSKCQLMVYPHMPLMLCRGFGKEITGISTCTCLVSHFFNSFWKREESLGGCLIFFLQELVDPLITPSVYTQYLFCTIRSLDGVMFCLLLDLMEGCWKMKICCYWCSSSLAEEALNIACLIVSFLSLILPWHCHWHPSGAKTRNCGMAWWLKAGLSSIVVGCCLLVFDGLPIYLMSIYKILKTVSQIGDYTKKALLARSPSKQEWVAGCQMKIF